MTRRFLKNSTILAMSLSLAMPQFGYAQTTAETGAEASAGVEEDAIKKLQQQLEGAAGAEAPAEAGQPAAEAAPEVAPEAAPEAAAEEVKPEAAEAAAPEAQPVEEVKPEVQAEEAQPPSRSSSDDNEWHRDAEPSAHLSVGRIETSPESHQRIQVVDRRDEPTSGIETRGRRQDGLAIGRAERKTR